MDRKTMSLKAAVILFLPWVLLGFAFAGPKSPSHDPAVPTPSEGRITYKVSGDVYFGDRNHFSNPCILCREKVFKKIPAYQKILRENLDRHSARYFFLLEEANKVFRSLVKEIAEKSGFDLVVEKGGISANPEVSFQDISDDVIKAI